MFESLCSFAEYDKGFPSVRCPTCNGKKLTKNVLTGDVPGLIFENPRESSKWNNWSYRQGKTWEEAKVQRAAAEKANKGSLPYKPIDDTNNGRRMNFID